MILFWISNRKDTVVSSLDTEFHMKVYCGIDLHSHNSYVDLSNGIRAWEPSIHLCNYIVV